MIFFCCNYRSLSGKAKHDIRAYVVHSIPQLNGRAELERVRDSQYTNQDLQSNTTTMFIVYVEMRLYICFVCYITRNICDYVTAALFC